MVQEIAEITIKPGMQAPFEAGVTQARALFLRGRGCRGVSLKHSIEEPTRYLLVVDWETVDDHMVHFRASEDFQTWRKLVGDCFTVPPQVQHVSTVL